MAKTLNLGVDPKTIAAASLERRARMQTAILNALGDAVVVADQHGTVVYSNPAATRMLGDPKTWPQGWQVFLGDGVTPCPPESLPLARAIRSEALDGVEFLLRRPDGAALRVSVNAGPLVEETTRGGIVSMRDVTESSRMAEALRASDARFRTLVDSLQDVVFTLDRSLRVEAIYGKSPPWLTVGKPLGETLGLDATATHEEAITAAFLGAHRIYECAVMVGASRRHLQISLSPLRDNQGAIALLVGVARDVTEAKQLEQRLLLADRMSSLGTLAAGVAHEINNPLAYVIGNLELVDEGMTELAPVLTPSTSGLPDRIAAARKGAERVRRIVSELRTLTRGNEQTRDAVDVRKVCEFAAEMAGHEIRRRAQLVRDFQPVDPVLGDDARLGQVVLNLLVNAAQSIVPGRPSENQIRLSVRPHGQRVLIEVADTGSGIPADVLPRIFDPFFTTKPVGTGTGLGLYITHGIITSLGGEITVASEAGKGTTFRVSLPRASVTAAAPAAQKAADASARGRVLVVDDEPEVSAVVKGILADEHDVETVTSGAAALARLRAGGEFDVILCDFRMPGMTGMELLVELEKTMPRAAAKVIFLTGAVADPELAARREKTVVEKPFDAEILRHAVREGVTRSRKPG